MSALITEANRIEVADPITHSSVCGYFDKIRRFPDIILNIINRLIEKKDYTNIALSSKMMLILSTFPLGRDPLSTNMPRSWLHILQDLYPRHSSDFQTLHLSQIIQKMPNFEQIPSPTHPLSAATSATIQFLSMDLPKESSEAYLQNGLIRKLMRNKYLNSVVNQIKDGENRNKSNYYIFYHSCSLSSYIFTEFTKSLIEAAKTCGEKHTDLDLNQISWFRFPQFNEDEKFLTVSDFQRRFSLEEGTSSKNDHDPMIQKQLMCVVPFPFSSLTDPGECAWNFFEDNRNVNPLSREKYFTLLCDHFQLLPSLPDREKFLTLFIKLHGQFCLLAHRKLKKIHQELQVRDSENVDPRGVICQILVPNQIADKVIYLSKPYGFVDHSQDTVSFDALMRKISSNPWEHANLQFRILAHHINNIHSGIVVNNYGYGNFFSSPEAAELRKEIHNFFLNVFITTFSSRF